ncbi:hypothetical protein BKA82DRAFT_4096454 [Pisolithus tinctorius]|nr:hypothetical protein BKA82DRAFT_4096454 [Pisolithus tinctorius]
MSLTHSSDVAIAKNELAAARAELARLQNRERELLEELCSVRAATRLQKDKIDNLFKHHRLPAPITRLPLTVLSDIIHHVIFNVRPESDAHRCTKRQLASVSRLWRDAIFSFPNLWTTIVIEPSWSTSLLWAHIERSEERPLDIIISNGSHYGMNDSSFNELLCIAVTCGYRWRSLVIRQANPATVSNIWRMRFPSLECVQILGVRIPDKSLLLTSRCAPSLKYLTLWDQGSIDQLPAVSNLNTGEFRWSCSGSGPRLLSSLFSCQQLRRLVLSGPYESGDQWPEPQSIYLPALVSLTIDLINPQPALAAMVVPNLHYLWCSLTSYTHNWAHVFGGFPNVFTNVRHLSLNHAGGSTEADAEAVYAACPDVYQVELSADDIPAFFHGNTPADRWPHLEHLTLEGMKVGTIPRDLKEWFDGRKSRGQPPLPVTLFEFRETKGAPNGWLTFLCKLLRGHCLLELKDFPLKTTLKMHTSSQGDVLDSYGSCDSVRIFINERLEG